MQSPIQQNKTIHSSALRCLAILIILILAYWAYRANQGHRAEQGIYRDRHKVLGEHIWSGIGYRYDVNEDLATYPLWGYPVIVGFLGSDNLVVAIQISLITISLLFFFKDLLDQPKYVFFIPLLLPILLHASVKWADAWYVLAMIWLLYALLHESSWIAIIASSVAASMRPDFIFIVIFGLLASLIFSKLRRVFLFALIGALISFIPWFAFTKSITSTNGGLVAYISLGQLPGNPWGRKYSDSAGFDYVQQFNVESPVSKEGNALLLKATLSDIRMYPEAYAHKVLNNLNLAMRGGVYIGEFNPYLILINQSISLSLVAAFILVTIGQVLHRKVSRDVLFAWIILIFTLLWVSHLQYINRHMNVAYSIILLVTTRNITFIKAIPFKFIKDQ